MILDLNKDERRKVIDDIIRPTSVSQRRLASTLRLNGGRVRGVQHVSPSVSSSSSWFLTFIWDDGFSEYARFVYSVLTSLLTFDLFSSLRSFSTARHF